ncbi:hypothetical protein [Paraglaciecola sp. L3A3]|uniref:hypothetical protein n=1 Tax=Paraglaciecola sp. L3A3 TaxID=2686358 RepID=UPI00131C57E1|nr:hypothetical protein [Paraglaciecola sp. L3A3]
MNKFLLPIFSTLAFSTYCFSNCTIEDITNEPVKLTTSGLCHDSNSSYYKQIKNGYKTSFNTVEECVESGFALPKSYYEKNESELYLKGLSNKTALLLQQPMSTAIATKLGNCGAVNSTAIASQSNVADPSEVVENVKAQQAQEEDIKKSYDFGGFNWNPAIVLLAYSDKPYIEDITIERQNETDAEGVVRIGKEVDYQMALMIETHWYFGIKKNQIEQFGYGPFLAVSLAKQEGDGLGTTIGFGPMIGWYKGEGKSMNIGLGYFIDTDFTTIRGDLQDGDMTTEKDSTKLLRKRDSDGVMLLFTATF